MSNDKSALLLSLGHNSSAILVDRGKTIGYEQERLDRIKSSSAPPVQAIEQIRKANFGINGDIPVFVTHWFDTFGELPRNKYTHSLLDMFERFGSTVGTHTKDFTHHDAHAWSSLSFYRHYRDETCRRMTISELVKADIEYKWFLVADGFGNRKEVLSLYYSADCTDLTLALRVYGYKNSLGLMYQYATKFCGMKMNQDEYKFLGYESKATFTVSLPNKNIIDSLVHNEVLRLHIDWANHNDMPDQTEDLIDFVDLENTEQYWYSVFNQVLNKTNTYSRNSDYTRSVIGYFIQEVLEKSLIKLVESRDIKNLILSGGVFYNVKANHALLEATDGLFSVVPLAGDQGAAIGFYEKYLGHFNWDTLCIGDRDMSEFDLYHDLLGKNIEFISDEEILTDILFAKIAAGQVCNLITDKMEYGPRALGATSSLFLPTAYNAEYNNKLNHRNEVMPFAPMVLAEAMPLVFRPGYRRVVGSDKFMILTYDYRMSINESNEGVAHTYPYNISRNSGRPEVIDYKRNKPLHTVLTNLWNLERMPLIANTSFNYHGEPIVFSAKDIIHTHLRQLDNQKSMRGNTPHVNLIIYKSKEST